MTRDLFGEAGMVPVVADARTDLPSESIGGHRLRARNQLRSRLADQDSSFIERPTSALSPTMQCRSTTTRFQREDDNIFGGDGRDHYHKEEEEEVIDGDGDESDEEETEDHSIIVLASNRLDACSDRSTESHNNDMILQPASQRRQDDLSHTSSTNDPEGGENKNSPPSSCLKAVAHILASHPTYDQAQDIAWQCEIRAAATKAKQFGIEVTQELELMAFALMRPGSPFIQILHSIAMYTV
jgi:hypothetical protein